MVPPGSRVADIGTDQALLPRWLLSSGRATHCIASERDPARLARAGVARERHPLRHRLELRHGDGLSVLEPTDAVDVLVVAGLGARATCRILGRSNLGRLGIRRLLLQPQTAPASVRRWLLDRGFGIVEERLIEDGGRFYPIIAAEPGVRVPVEGPVLCEEDLLEVGPCLLRSGAPEVGRFWQEELRRNEEILALGAAGLGRAEAMRRRDLSRRILTALPGITSAPSGKTRRCACPR